MRELTRRSVPNLYWYRAAKHNLQRNQDQSFDSISIWKVKLSQLHFHHLTSVHNLRIRILDVFPSWASRRCQTPIGVPFCQGMLQQMTGALAVHLPHVPRYNYFNRLHDCGKEIPTGNQASLELNKGTIRFTPLVNQSTQII